MDESIVIKQRRYKNIFNHITDTLTPYLKDPSWKLMMVRSGVTIDDTDEIISVVAAGVSYISFRVTIDSFIVKSVRIDNNAFDNVLGIFNLKDKRSITDYLNSFIGLDLNLYYKEDV